MIFRRANLAPAARAKAIDRLDAVGHYHRNATPTYPPIRFQRWRIECPLRSIQFANRIQLPSIRIYYAGISSQALVESVPRKIFNVVKNLSRGVTRNDAAFFSPFNKFFSLL